MNDELRSLAICILLGALVFLAMFTAGVFVIIKDFIENPIGATLQLVAVAIGISIATLMRRKSRRET